MKHLFILNPVAGRGKKAQNNNMDVAEKIRQHMQDAGEEYEIYTTTFRMDAAEKVRREAQLGNELRVYACGGDGTLNECVHGAAGFKNVAVTHYPCGTGNDFIRMFGEEAGLFSDLDALLKGEVRPIDVIDCTGRKSINICSVGIDARVGADVHKYSKLPLIGGAGGYVVSTVVNILKGINRPFKIKADGFEKDDKFAFACACNGRYYGGGFNPTKTAMIDDGMLEILIAGKLSVFKAAVVIGKYAKGLYYELPEIVTYIKGRKIEIESQEPFIINVDGEIITGRKAVIRLIPRGINFLFPAGMKFAEHTVEKTETAAAN